jgi:hypothetical protein
MADTPLGAPIPVGVINAQLDQKPALALASPEGQPQGAAFDDAVNTSMRTADALMLAPLKFGLATMLAGAALACNPFFATSGYKLPSANAKPLNLEIE